MTSSRRPSDESRAARPGAPLRRALEDLASTSSALDKARSALRAEEEGRQGERQRSAEQLRSLRRRILKMGRELEHARRHVTDEKIGREEAEDREVKALQQAQLFERRLEQQASEIEDLRRADQRSIEQLAARNEALQTKLATIEERMQRTDGSHATIRERVVALERELGEARSRAIELTTSRDAERRSRERLDLLNAKLERELADAMDRSEQLVHTLDVASRIERGLHRYADKKEGQLLSAKRMLKEARVRLERIGGDIAAARKRVALPEGPQAPQRRRAN